MTDRLTEFTTLVARMREAQKKYFKDRTQSALATSKQLERQVDAWLTAKAPVSTETQMALPSPEWIWRCRTCGSIYGPESTARATERCPQCGAINPERPGL